MVTVSTQDPSNYPAQPVNVYQWEAEGRVAAVDPGTSPTGVNLSDPARVKPRSPEPARIAKTRVEPVLLVSGRMKGPEI